MNYQEQLKDARWREKRNEIFSRDKYSCQNCENDSYNDKTSSGLVVSNSLDFVGKTHFGVEKWRFLVWDLQDNMLFRGSTNNPIFSTDKSYICYYRNRLDNGFKPSVLGLKEIPNSEIRFRDVDFIEKITTDNYRQLVEEQTFNLLYSSVYPPKTWSITCGLQVHHKYYQDGKYAWEYPNDALETLCPSCHNEIHQTTIIPILDANENELERIYYPTAIPDLKSIVRRRR